MPYELRSENGRHCVAKKGGETLKCYDDKGDAMKYFRALQANVHDSRDSLFPEFSMAIVKANTDKNGVMRWRSVNSDTGKDAYDECMSKELFQDFIQHINNEDDIPEPFKSVICEEEWCGGMPYVSLAHYKSGSGRVNVPGEPNKIYLDGDVLKSTGILYDTPLGKAVFKSLQKDLVEKRDDKIRISIGFLDLEHSHGEKFTFVRKALTDKCPLCKEDVGDKIYKKGHLVHLALTRVPANPRTDVEVERSMTTKKEDLESIVEDDEITKGLDLKSQAEDVLVIKAEEECEEGDEECKKKMDKMHEEKSIAEPVAPVEAPVENTVFSNPQDAGTSSVTVKNTFTPADLPDPVEQAFASLKSRIAGLKAQGLTGEAALQQVQADFDQIGEVIKSEFTPPPSPEDEARKNLETTLRSLLNEMLPQALAQTVAPIQSKLESLEGELRAKSLTTPIRKEQVETVQRSLTPTQVQKAMVEQIANKSKDQFQLLAEQSTFGNTLQ